MQNLLSIQKLRSFGTVLPHLGPHNLECTFLIKKSPQFFLQNKILTKWDNSKLI